jgi:hypothetical protein
MPASERRYRDAFIRTPVSNPQLRGQSAIDQHITTSDKTRRIKANAAGAGDRRHLAREVEMQHRSPHISAIYIAASADTARATPRNSASPFNRPMAE